MVPDRPGWEMQLGVANSIVFRRLGRRGFVLLVAMVCVAITAVVFVALLRLALAQEEAVRADAEQLQASWLAESAVDRAVAKLRADNGYRGETWNLPAQALAGVDDAVVEIKIELVPERPEFRRINVRADYPSRTEFRSRRSKSIAIMLGGDMQ